MAGLVVAIFTMAAVRPAEWRWTLPSGIAPPTVPADNPITAAKVELGRRLFYDADLSINGTMSCATCHEQKHGFADDNATRPGVHGDPGRRNVPGLANVGYSARLTWADPRLTTLEAQVAVPVLGAQPVEMGMAGKEAEIGTRLGRDHCYFQMFADAFSERRGKIDLAGVAMALATFQRTMIAFDTSFDRYKRGRMDAISAEAQRGYELFMGRGGCANCHSGPNFSDDNYHALAAQQSKVDLGLGEVTGSTTDDGKFRTPSLRNIALTAPYMHDGSASTLVDALRRHDAGATLSERDRSDLIAFLDQLTDQRFITDKRFALPSKACGKRL
ncbi:MULTISPECIES: cytochrome-c peroxidase [Sphingobium]|uniref:cytochrome-c peroxidase n=1 Tax=Sphingobium sp. MI1205 TaxID=407020 RepID=UPI00077009D2|nr:cytochrome c peroxidase [Sphingobium sp. MI1205]AMK17173.1 cytochrome-c peroxidase [Sphingobium sp. MI1205]